jgi:hypothetical protein
VHAVTGRRRPIVGGCVSLAIVLGLQPSLAPAAASPERVASVIETFLRWAVEGKELPADPPQSPPALPHRDCGGRLDPEHLPAVVYVTWGLSAEGQHAACNWRYDVASHHATPLTPAEAGDVAQRISAGTVPPEERAFFHTVAQRDGRLAVTAGYCWGSASGTFSFSADKAVLTGPLAVHGY